MEKFLVAASGDSLDAKVSGRFGHSGRKGLSAGRGAGNGRGLIRGR